MKIEIIREIDKVRTMNVTQLRKKYLEIFGEETRSGNKDFLWKRIAWRIQAIEEGDLSERARQRAEELAADADLRVRAPVGNYKKATETPQSTSVYQFRPMQDNRVPLPGAILSREYKGSIIRVMVLENGFEFNGKVYRTLTAISKEITGKHWNGYHFFGLLKAGQVA